MSVILKPLFEILTGEVAVMDNILYNYMIMLVVGEVAYRLAWNFVGDLYDLGVIGGKASGSIIHWFIRTVVYIACAYIMRGCIWIYEIVLAVPNWIWWVLLSFGVATFIAVVLLEQFLKLISVARTGEPTLTIL